MTQYKAIKVNGKKHNEHRYIMEQHLGRPLSRYEVVHHINGDKTDNRLCNLMVMSLSEHAKLHRIGAKATEQTRDKLAKASQGNTHSRKLLDEQIEQIKSLHELGLSQRKIADIVGSNHTTIGQILNGQAYKQL